MFIRIIKRPQGEAPEWVRDAWIGVVMPTLQIHPIEYESFGVLSGPKGPIMERLASLFGRGEKFKGYAVYTIEALGCLEPMNPRAATWWRENCPHLMGPGGGLMFRADECEVVGGEPAND